MIGTKMTAATNMTERVFCDEVASQTVRLCAGFRLDGMMNGNMLKPAVRIMPAMVKEDVTKAKAPCPNLASNEVNNAITTPNTGATIIQG